MASDGPGGALSALFLWDHKRVNAGAEKEPKSEPK